MNMTLSTATRSIVVAHIVASPSYLSPLGIAVGMMSCTVRSQGDSVDEAMGGREATTLDLLRSLSKQTLQAQLELDADEFEI